jgi:hypothetical protein
MLELWKKDHESLNVQEIVTKMRHEKMTNYDRNRFDQDSLLQPSIEDRKHSDYTPLAENKQRGTGLAENSIFSTTHNSASY